MPEIASPNSFGMEALCKLTIDRFNAVAHMGQDMKRPCSFALLSGPAGFGKTTLLSESVAEYQQPVAWVSLDEADNDPIRFWTYLIAACQSIQREIGESILPLL